MCIIDSHDNLLYQCPGSIVSGVGIPRTKTSTTMALLLLRDIINFFWSWF